jgi:hypothetical protein
MKSYENKLKTAYGHVISLLKHLYKCLYHNRMIGMIRGVTKLPTYRRKFRHVVKALLTHSLEKDASQKILVTHSMDRDVSEKSLVTRYLEKDPSGRSSTRSIVSVPSDDNV